MARAIQTRDANIQYWDTISNTNPVYQGIRQLADTSSQIIGGSGDFFTIVGPAGVGKTYVIERGLKQYERRYRVISAATTRGLLEDLASAAQNEEVAIIDDADSILDTRRNIEVFQRATDTKSSRIYRERQANGTAMVYDLSDLTVVLISNIGFRWTRRGMIGRKLEALRTRARQRYIDSDRQAIWEYTCYMAVVRNYLKAHGFGLAAVNDVLRYFWEHGDQLDDVSPRGLLMLCRERRSHPDRWQDACANYLRPDLPKTGPYGDVVPQIITTRPD